jgi:heat shock protein HslJ
MRWMMCIGFCLCLLAVSAGCTSAPVSDDRLNGTSWEISDSLFPKTLVFENSSAASGFGGMNHYRTEYTASGDSLTFGTVSVDTVPVPESLLQDEAHYFASLEAVAYFQLREGELVMMDKDGNLLLHFDKSGKYADLSETQWMVTGFPAAALPVTGEITLDFGQDGIFDGFIRTDGYYCGFYSSGGSSLILGNITGADSGNIYYEQLEKVRKYSAEDGVLTLSDADDVPLVLLRERTGTEVLAGIPWKAETVLSGSSALAPENNITLTFDQNGSYAGTIGLQPYNGVYHVSGKALAVTQSAGSSDADQYLKNLEKTVSYQITPDGDLAVYDRYGNLLIIFCRTP